MSEKSLKYRDEVVKKLENEKFDILIIGGGITGAGIARDAALRKLKVALIEKGDFGSGTSSGSSKLVHAGLRYLAQKEFRLVFEASKERKKLLEMAPHLTRPLKFLIPLHSDTKTPKNKIRLAVWLYDFLAGFKNYTFHQILGEEKSREVLPKSLRSENFQGAALYGDGQMDDARLTLDVILSAEEYGAYILNYCLAEEYQVGIDEKIETVVAVDRISGKKIKIAAKYIILACGHWTDKIIRQLNPKTPIRILPSKGIHIITEKFYDQDFAVVVPVKDGRIIFLVPFGDNLLIGTTDTEYSEDLDYVPVLNEEIEYLIEAINFIFPGILKRENILSAYSGVRPLVLSPNAKSESDTSRKHEIFSVKANTFAIAGGKYTTYRSMAKEIVDKVSKELSLTTKCISDKMPLYGWQAITRSQWNSWKTLIKEEMIYRYNFPDDVAEHLTTYGKHYKSICEISETNPELKKRISGSRPYIFAEVVYMIKNEKVVTLNDVMLRRTQIQLSENQGLDCVEDLAQFMGKYMDWTPEKIANEIKNYHESLVFKPTS
ncbi:glycerol-3-phosphate dehydrogenase/oxidase [Candidatus Hodarchaeum mangrovi]